MRIFNQIAITCAVFIMLIGCKKSTTDPNPEPTNDLLGTWHVDNYVVANIYATGTLYNDTVDAQSDEIWTFGTDSLYTASRLLIEYDLTTEPPTFSASDSSLHASTRAYSFTSGRIVSKGAVYNDTLDIITLTSSQLVVHESVPPNLGFNDTYISLHR